MKATTHPEPEMFPREHVRLRLPEVTSNRQNDPDPPAAGSTTPAARSAYRHRPSAGDDTIDPDSWSGAIPEAHGVSPRIRIGRDKWLNLLWLLPIGFVLLIVAVAVAQGLRHVTVVERFIARYPGTIVPSNDGASTGVPVWVDVTHFLNLFAHGLHHPLGHPDLGRPSAA